MTFFVDENVKVGTLCPTLDISTLKGASKHRWLGIYQDLNIELQPGKVDDRIQRAIRKMLFTLDFLNVSAEMESALKFWGVVQFDSLRNRKSLCGRKIVVPDKAIVVGLERTQTQRSPLTHLITGQSLLVLFKSLELAIEVNMVDPDDWD